MYCEKMFNPNSKFNKVCPICKDKNAKRAVLKAHITRANSRLNKQKKNENAI